MKKHVVMVLSIMMVAAFAVPSMAKVNLSGALWVTYWAQQEGSVQLEEDAGTWWNDLNGNNFAAPTYGAAGTTAKKTFFVGQNMSGNGLQAKAVRGNGFALALDCPVNDWVKAFGQFNATSNNLNQSMSLAYINLAFMTELNVRAGRMTIPFGYEQSRRPTVGVEEVFVSEYAQDADAALIKRQDVGVMVFGSLANSMVDYKLFVGNGGISTVADSVAIAGSGAIASTATPDIDDAKQVGLNLCFKPFTGAFVGGAYFGGDYTNAASGVSCARAKFTAYDVNAGYEYNNMFRITGEYATTRHDKLSQQFMLGTTAGVAGTLVQNRVNEYIVKGIYTGVADWEFGVRYGVVDPKNIEAEWQAQYSMEKKLSFAVAYKFARAANLKAEYSWLDTNVRYLNNIDAGSALLPAGATRQNTSQDVDDDIFALSLGLQF